MKAEQFIKDYTKNCSNRCSTIEQYERGDEFHPWLTPEQALSAVKIAREEAIEEAISFLENDVCCYIVAQDFAIEHERLEKDFRKFMEEQV